MNKKLCKRVFALSFALLLIISVLPLSSVKAAVTEPTQNQRNMVARADWCYGITWVAQETVAGWGSTFYKGYTYHIPYGQPIMSGKYVGYGATYEEFIEAAATAGSIFYTGRSWCDGTTAPYYATDCSSFVSWVWGINRTTTYYIPGVSSNMGSVTTYNATHTLRLGDALNSNAHVVLVSGLDYDASGNITRIEITEQTPPQMKRSSYTPYELYQKYYNYTIQRYYGDVPPAPDADDEKPVISNLVYSNVSASGYTVSCTVTDNTAVSKVAFPTWTLKNGQDDLAANFLNTQLGTKNGDTYTFRVNTSDHNNETGDYATHIYAFDRAGNMAKLEPPHIEVRNDTQNPVISDVVYSDVSSAGYTVSCKVTDDWGVYSVAFPTWTIHNGQDDLPDQFLTTQLGNKNGDRYTFRVKASDHNNETGTYVTHIYATDCAGNRVSLPLSNVEVRNDTTNPVISDAVISNVTAAGYTVTCKVTDDWGVNTVAFPTWTHNNGQDDLADNFMNTQKGTKDGNTYTFVVKASDHNNETGFYTTHIYAKDCAGNTISLPLDPVEVKDPSSVDPTLEEITLVSSSIYTIGDLMVNGVAESTSVDSLLKQFQNKTLEVVDGKGMVISGSAIVGTGAQINLYENDKIIDSVSVVVLGDVDGNGIVDTTDIVRVKAAFLGSFMLDDAESNAADVDGNGIIDTTDYMRVMSHFLGSYDLYE